MILIMSKNIIRFSLWFLIFELRMSNVHAHGDPHAIETCNLSRIPYLVPVMFIISDEGNVLLGLVKISLNYPGILPKMVYMHSH